MQIFLPLSKVDVERCEVWGTMAQELADKSGEIMDYATSKPNFESWSKGFEKATNGESLGNVREMHGHSAVGKITQMDFDDANKSIDVCVKVVDDVAWKKVLENVYTGFSIGGSYAKRWQDGALKRYTAQPAEVSLVDNPCLPTATYTMVKSDGTTEQKPFGKVAEGKSKYGDVKFADAKNKRYPIDTPAHVRAAASYWGMPKNRSKYSPADQKTIGAAIASAKRKFGIGEASAEKCAEKMIASISGLADMGFEKQASALTATYGGWMQSKLKKGLCEVGSLAYTLQQLHYLAITVEEEALREGDNSDIPARLAEIREKLGEVLVDMAEEETDELNPEGEDDMEPTEKIAKALALISEVHGAQALGKAVTGKEHKDMVQEIHDHAAALGAGHNGVHDEELKKDGYKLPEIAGKSKDSAEKGKDEDADEKKHSEAEKMFKALTDRIAALESQPAASSGAKSVVVGKENDDAALSKAKADESPLGLYKAAMGSAKSLSPDDLMKLGR